MNLKNPFFDIHKLSINIYRINLCTCLLIFVIENTKNTFWIGSRKIQHSSLKHQLANCLKVQTTKYLQSFVFHSVEKFREPFNNSRQFGVLCVSFACSAPLPFSFFTFMVAIETPFYLWQEPLTLHGNLQMSLQLKVSYCSFSFLKKMFLQKRFNISY